MSKRDDTKPDYDKNILRFVGNCLSSRDWPHIGKQQTEEYIDTAIKAALYARSQLRKVAANE